MRTDVTVIVLVRMCDKSITPALQTCLSLDPSSVVIVDSVYDPRQSRYCRSAHLKKLHDLMGARITHCSYPPKYDDGRSVMYLSADCSMDKQALERTLEDMNCEHRTISKHTYMPMHTVRSASGAWVLNGVLLVYFVLQWMRSFFFRFAVDRLPHRSHVELERRCTTAHLETTAYELVLSKRGLLDTTISRLIGNGYASEPKQNVGSGGSEVKREARSRPAGMAQLAEFMQNARSHSVFSLSFSVCTLMVWVCMGLLVAVSPWSVVAPFSFFYGCVASFIFVIGTTHMNMKGVWLFSLLYPVYAFALLFMWPFCAYECSKRKNDRPHTVGEMGGCALVKLLRYKSSILDKATIAKFAQLIRNTADQVDD